eukprot:CFRG7766T1
MGKAKSRKNKPMAKAHAGQEALEIAKIEALCERVGLDTSDTPEVTTKFSSLPVSTHTLSGLKEAGYFEMTPIQMKAIPAALRGCDVLGAARTGSGKTLAFIIPIIEKLYRQKWSDVFGLGALIISPTRELAFQTFEVLRKVGKKHTLSAGLIIGGKDVETEQGAIARMNILVCTPGRLLQHMDETPGFVCDDLQILVLDEADRILDLGFAETLNAILDNLPRTRQTMLFSATQESGVKNLARLSLKDPKYISVHETSEFSTPTKLTQVYLVCELDQKMDILYSFLRTHTKDKILVFMSSCKQVRFVYEAFRNARPGLPLMALHGQQKQPKRLATYNDFSKKSEACLFATDIAARGLDFPAVNWVVQMDCPEDASTYIHRSGRTARYKSDGKALLMLLPSEETGMIATLTDRRIPLQRIKIDPKKSMSCINHVRTLCAKEADMKQLAQKSFVSYVRSVHLQSDKSIFDVNKLPLEAYAMSLGLSKAPKIRFVKKLKKQFGNLADKEEDHLSKRDAANVLKQAKEKDEEANNDSDIDTEFKPSVRTDESEDEAGWSDLGDNDDDEELLVIKPKDHNAESEDDEEEVALELERSRKARTQTKASQAKKLLSKGIVANKKITFDDEGEGTRIGGSCDEDDNYEGGIDIEAVKEKLKTQNTKDKENERRRLREKKREKKLKEKKRAQEAEADSDEEGGPMLVTLGGADDDMQDESESDGDVRARDANANSDDDESDYEELERPGTSRTQPNKKRARSESDSDSYDDDSDAEVERKSDDAFSSKRTRQMLKDEALALELLNM